MTNESRVAQPAATVQDSNSSSKKGQSVDPKNNTDASSSKSDAVMQLLEGDALDRVVSRSMTTGRNKDDDDSVVVPTSLATEGDLFSGETLTGFEAFRGMLATLAPVEHHGQQSQELWFKAGPKRLYVAPKWDISGRFPLNFTEKPVGGKKTDRDTSVRTHKDAYETLRDLTIKNGKVDGGVFYLPGQPQGLPLAENIGLSNDIGFESDDITTDSQKEQINEFFTYSGLLPVALVGSGGKSIHGHIRASHGLTVKQHQHLARLMVIVLMSDPVTISRAQAMRFPGFFRSKKDAEQPLYYVNPTARYSYEEIVEGFERFFNHKGWPMPELTGGTINSEWFRVNVSSHLKNTDISRDHRRGLITKALIQGVKRWEWLEEKKQQHRDAIKAARDTRKETISAQLGFSGGDLVSLVKEAEDTLRWDVQLSFDDHEWESGHDKKRGKCCFHSGTTNSVYVWSSGVYVCKHSCCPGGIKPFFYWYLRQIGHSGCVSDSDFPSGAEYKKYARAFLSEFGYSFPDELTQKQKEAWGKAMRDYRLELIERVDQALLSGDDDKFNQLERELYYLDEGDDLSRRSHHTNYTPKCVSKAVKRKAVISHKGNAKTKVSHTTDAGSDPFIDEIESELNSEIESIESTNNKENDKKAEARLNERLGRFMRVVTPDPLAEEMPDDMLVCDHDEPDYEGDTTKSKSHKPGTKKKSRHHKDNSDVPTDEQLLTELRQIADSGIGIVKAKAKFIDLASYYGSTPYHLEKLYEQILIQIDEEIEDESVDVVSTIERISKLDSTLLSPDEVKDCGYLMERLEPVLQHSGFDLTATLGCVANVAGVLCAPGTILVGDRKKNMHGGGCSYSGILGDPGMAKTHLINLAVKPLFKLQQKLNDARDDAMLLYQIEKDDWDEELKDLKESLKGKTKGGTSKPAASGRMVRERVAQWQAQNPKPVMPRADLLCVTDVTAEARDDVLAENRLSGLLHLSDELKAYFNTDRYAKKGGLNETRNLSNRDTTYNVKIRKSEGNVPVVINNQYSVLGGIQPGVLAKAMGDFSDDDGTWSRFFWYRLKHQRSHITENNDDDFRFDLSQDLANIYEIIYRQPRREYLMSRKARKMYIEWFNYLDEQKIKEGVAKFETSLYSKAQRFTLDLALGIHLMSNAARLSLNTSLSQLDKLKADELAKLKASGKPVAEEKYSKSGYSFPGFISEFHETTSEYPQIDELVTDETLRLAIRMIQVSMSNFINFRRENASATALGMDERLALVYEKCVPKIETTPRDLQRGTHGKKVDLSSDQIRKIFRKLAANKFGELIGEGNRIKFVRF